MQHRGVQRALVRPGPAPVRLHGPPGSAAPFVRWYGATGRRRIAATLAQAMQRLGMQRLRWEVRRVGGVAEARYNCIDAASIMRRVFPQPDPTAADQLLYNHYVR